MNRKQFIALCDGKVRLVRAECTLNQEKMARALGLSKKTLVEIEKGRASLGWTGSVALCALFGGSEMMTAALGGPPDELLRALAFEGEDAPLKIAGGAWWQTVHEANGYVIQQNMISQHYRLLDRDGQRIASALNLEDLTIKE
ncbi:MAG: transcriptional regulator [Oscillospiraceae bacterium]|nr:transcriptional regulator [Oscillospiraceae bacterium]